MQNIINKKIVKKTAIRLIITAFLISFLAPFLRAEDNPGYIGSGYRDYLSEKKQNGYYVEVFAKMDMRQKARIDKRNQIEEILQYSTEATPESKNEILAAEFQHKDNTDKLKTEIIQQRQQREQVASVNLEGGFTYIPYSDGKTVYFKDSLPIRIENERAVDEFGNISLKNTYNMQYNNRRLMTSYEATLKDNLGNISYLRWYGAKYTADSVFYGNHRTNANQNLSEYYLEETDSAGNVNLTHWNALSYEGKLLRAFTQTVDDGVYGRTEFTRSNITYANNDPKYMNSYHEVGIGTDGLHYTLDRTNISYNDLGQLLGYHEEAITTQIDGNPVKTTTDAQFKYIGPAYQFGPDVEEPDPNRLLESTITTTTENTDGSHRTETNVTNYQYQGTQLTGASGHTNFNGQEPDWWKYTDNQGHILSLNTDNTYSYVDPDTLETIYVAEDLVTATLKDGNKYTGTSDTQYEILSDGRPIVKEVNSRVSYYGRNISPDELINIETTKTTYDNALVTYTNESGLTFSKVQVLGKQEHTELIYPLLDPDNSHKTTTDKSYKYKYDPRGNLEDLILVSGTGSGWEYDPNRGWYGQYISTITEEWTVILGKPLMTDSDAVKNYLH